MKSENLVIWFRLIIYFEYTYTLRLCSATYYQKLENFKNHCMQNFYCIHFLKIFIFVKISSLHLLQFKKYWILNFGYLFLDILNVTWMHTPVKTVLINLMKKLVLSINITYDLLQLILKTELKFYKYTGSIGIFFQSGKQTKFGGGKSLWNSILMLSPPPALVV